MTPLHTSMQAAQPMHSYCRPFRMSMPVGQTWTQSVQSMHCPLPIDAGSTPRAREPRGSRARGVDPASIGKGQCIDCTLCVQVCPTGIDIRKGLQYECIGCAACIDVCNGVMDKMSYPRGLIRFATQNAMVQGWSPRTMWKRVARPRVLIYGAVLMALSSALVFSLATRAALKADVVRDRGTLARMVEDGRIENVYRLQLMNATEAAERVHVEVEGLPGATLPAWC